MTDEADDLGLTIVSASHSTFLVVIPEQDLDFTWTPQQSADRWRDYLLGDERALGSDFFVAEIDRTVVGFVVGGTETGREDYESRVGALYVRPTFHRRGIGRALISASAAALRNRGLNTLLIGCARENPSCGFYTRLGGIEVYRAPYNIDRFETEEIFFGYSDIEKLLVDR